MDIRFMNSKIRKTSDCNRSDLNRQDKLKRNDKYVYLSNLSIHYTWQIFFLSNAKTIHLE